MSSRKERNKSRKHGERLRREAQEALEAGNAALAVKLIARALEEGPGNARYWKEQGEILLAAREARAAERSLQQALTLSPDYTDAIEVLARLLEDRGDRERARELRERLARLQAMDAPRPPDEAVSEYARDATPLLTAGVDWPASESALVSHGVARIASVLSGSQCAAWRAAASASSRAGLDSSYGSSGALLESAQGAWDALVEELVSLLAAIAARASERLGRGRSHAPATAFLPARRPTARVWSLAASEPVDLAVPATRPCFPFSIALVLAADPEAARLVFSLVDLRSGRREHVQRCGASAGDIVIACARERWVRVGGTLGLQPVRRRLEATCGTIEALELAF